MLCSQPDSDELIWFLQSEGRVCHASPAVTKWLAMRKLHLESGVQAAVTRQITLPTSSATNNEFPGPMVTPTGRP